MLRFSLKRTTTKEVLKRSGEGETSGEMGGDHGDHAGATGAATSSTGDVVRVNYTSRTWLASLRKRTLSVESLSNMFSGVGRQDGARRESMNSGGGSMTGGSNSKLLRTHKMQTKSGDPVEIYFGYDALSINGRSIGYSDVVFWSHSASHFTMTYLSKTSGRRKDVVLYPTEKGPRPSELTDMLGVRIARLVADQTGCSEEKAMRMATAKANESELREAVQALDQHQSQDQPTAQPQPIKKMSEMVNEQNSGRSIGRQGGSGMIEVNVRESTGGGASSRAGDSSLGDDGAGGVIEEVDEPQPTPF